MLDRGDGGSRSPLALHQPSAWSTKVVGEFEVFVCRGCGLAEWYVKDPGNLPADGEKIREIDGSNGGASAPYR